MGARSNFNLEQLFGKPLEEVDKIINDMDSNVSEFKIPKRTGGRRTITSASKALKYIQKSIHWKILKRYKCHDDCHGFVNNKGIVTNARVHIGAKSIGKIDIKDFFGSITEEHLKNILFGNKLICKYCKNYMDMAAGACNPSIYHNRNKEYSLKCEELKAVYIPNYCETTGYQSLFKRIIKLCTYKGKAVQGFPTSPSFSNLVLRGFDKSVSEHCKENDIVYSRYADDMTFSSKVKTPKELESIVKKFVYNHLKAYNFQPNYKKTKWKSKGGRMTTCGIVVNEKTNLHRKKVMHFRSAVHHATVIDAHKTTKAEIRKLKGWCAYFMSVNPQRAQKYMDKLIAFEKSLIDKVFVESERSADSPRFVRSAGDRIVTYNVSTATNYGVNDARGTVGTT